MRLYHHKTDGGAGYLCSSNVKGTDEGSFDSTYIVRIDGNIEKDAELNIKPACNSHDELVECAQNLARLSIQSDRYRDDTDFARDVDACFAALTRAKEVER
ncbi:MAG: hypothetical protein KKD18_02800 [Nanoarchaeota archaeon]|nr:hypothetical protein [Nanoarchaeota archaeon]